MSRQVAQLEEYRQRNKENDVTESMYLGDIKKRHTENRKLLEKDLRRVVCQDHKHIAFMSAHLIAVAAQKLGVPALFMKHNSIIKKKSFSKREQQRLEGRMSLDLEKSGVTVEPWPPPKIAKEIESQWHGIYFYKNNEIVYFISAPLQQVVEKSLIITTYQQPRNEYFLLTNVPEG